MALAGFIGSSRKSRRVPISGALCGTGAGCVENGLWPPKFRSHNMGLCDANGEGGGRGVGERSWF